MRRDDSVSASLRLNHMHLRLIALFVIGVASISSAAETQDQKSPTLDELVAKNIEAKGGADALRALQSLRSTGKMIVNEGQLELAYVETKKRPGEVRAEFTLQGMTAVQAYDGKEGWKISPLHSSKDPFRLSADDVNSLMEDAEIDGPLASRKAKDRALEYLGEAHVDGTSAYKIKVL